MVNLTDYPVLTEESEAVLNKREKLDYEEHRRDFIEWLVVFGKDPERVVGYADDTVRRSAYRVDKFYRWKWEQDGYTTNLSCEDADEYMRDLAVGDYSNSHKANTQKSIKRLFKWRKYEQGGSLWEPRVQLSE